MLIKIFVLFFYILYLLCPFLHWLAKQRLGIQLYHESLSCLEFSLLIRKVRKSQNMSQSLILSWQSKCIFPNQKLRFIRLKIVYLA